MLPDQPVILFYGVCNFCNYWVNFAIKRDKKKKLKFATLQGNPAKLLLQQCQFNSAFLSSVILIDHGKVYTESSATLRICKYLTGGWKLCYGLIIVPKLIRDFFYNIIAQNRYR